MNNSENIALTDILLDVKEAYLISISKRLIYNHIPDSEILILARSLPASDVIKKLKNSYFFRYYWNKMMRERRKKWAR